MADGKALITSLRLVPKNLWSRFVGAAARTPLPRGLRQTVLGGFARRYDIDVDEATLPLEDYSSLADFFVRHLKDDARPLCGDPEAVLSPADGHVLHGGALQAGRALQAKGRDYSVRELLADDPLAAELEGGSYATVYLSPRDYHRVHCPVEGHVTGHLHVPGTLWPVNAAGVAHVDRLFCCNERLVTFLDTEAWGPVAVILVGATAVGRITAAYDDRICTNRGGCRAPKRVTYDEPRPLARGGQLGVFHLGSTVVLLVSRPGLAPVPEHGAPVRMGEALLRPEE